MESMYKLLQVRRSHRKFTEQPVEQEKIDAILRNALMSPAGKSLNPWEFIVVTDKEMQEKMSKCKPFGGAFLAEAPLSIVIIANIIATNTPAITTRKKDTLNKSIPSI